jgi:type I restriction enzyme, S subunit
MSRSNRESWSTARAENYCRSVRDGTHDSPRFVENGYPLVTSKHIEDGRLAIESANLISEQDFREINKRSEVEQWDLLFTMIGTLGEVYLVTEESPQFAIKNVALFKCGDELRARWLYYWLKNPKTKTRLLQERRGASQQYIPLGALRTFEIQYPNSRFAMRRTVDKIAQLDDLIENNRQRIALLEKSARLLYTEWFVHFRFPGHERSKLIHGLPEGWSRKSLSACATFQSGGTPSKANSEFWEGDVPWISSGELMSMRIRSATHHVTDEAVRSGSRYAEVGTILGVVRGMSLAKEFRLGITTRRVCFNQDLKAFVPDRGVEPLYLFHALDAQKGRIRQLAGEASHGTKKLETTVLENLQIPVALPRIRKHFVDYVSVLHEQMDVLTEQNNRLEQAHALLLPRLMNGEIAV